MSRRATRRARRDLERRMRELDRLDAQFGLGTMPSLRARSRSRRPRGATLGGTVVGLLATALAVLAVAPGEAGAGFREFTGLGRDHRLLPEVTPAVASHDYEVLQRLPDGSPITYDPCKPIHYAVNPLGAPPDYLTFIESAVREVESATGLRFIYDGVSDDEWRSRRRALSRRPLLITFNQPTEVQGLAGKTVGLGGSVAWAPLGRTPRYLTGSVALDSPWFLEASRAHRGPQQRAVVMHELGHVVGLDHVDDPTQLMAADNHGQVEFAAGDLAGLAELGAGPCD